MKTLGRLILQLLVVGSVCYCQTGPETQVPVSPKSGWGDFKAAPPAAEDWQHTALMWLPNRVLDFIDIFRADVGVGPAVGANVRVTRYAQAAYRDISPFSVRAGLFGRKMPLMVENSSEIGISPGYIGSKSREVCVGEIGVGVDLIAGGYAGVCVDELIDFVGGFFLLDFKHDDY
ncbi:MAG: hypothetical protein H6619_01560 [Deltaproteobacteria bacterium]|nr:hypothetical protein [Deltaproteobacteria bacterium]